MKKNNYGLPISYSGITHKSGNEIVFYNVMFKKDFGDFNKGDLVEELIYDVKKCTLVENKQFIISTEAKDFLNRYQLQIKKNTKKDNENEN